MQSVEAACWAPQGISDLEYRVSAIFNSIRQWSGEWSELDLASVLEPTRWPNISAELLKEGCFLSPERLRSAINANEVMTKQGRASSLLLTSLVSFIVTREVLCKPLFMLDTQQADVFATICGWVREASVPNAEMLRYSILRFLDPPGHHPSPGIAKLNDFAEQCRTAVANILASGIIDVWKGSLIADEDVTRAHHELSSIVKDATDLSWSLWCRKYRYDMLSMPALRKFRGLSDSTRYKCDSEYVEAHPLHNGALDDDPGALNSREIVLLAAPAIRRLGTNDGEDYETVQMLKKAIAWMG